MDWLVMRFFEDIMERKDIDDNDFDKGINENEITHFLENFFHTLLDRIQGVLKNFAAALQ
jgi:hypothetical protein